MPLVKISLRDTNPAAASRDAKKKLLDIIHATLVEVFKIPDFDRFQRLEIYSPDDFELPSNRTPDAILIEITAFPGRTTDTKKKLYRSVVDRIHAGFGIPVNDITIVIYEPGLECWGIRGGQTAAEVDMGFDLKV
ncbi:MAG: tautomerase family protein [Brevinematales bacterium]|nr:tautomerase family protein [Brevinematales bacterium]